MKRIFCMALVMMLALSCVSAFAAGRTVYGPTTGKVDVELSVTLKNFYTWMVPGDDEDMIDGVVDWGKVGLTGAKFSSGSSYVYIYAASENQFNLVHATKKTSVIPYRMTVEGEDVTTQEPATMDGGKTAYFVMKSNSTTEDLKMCRYEMSPDKPNDCGWYRDTVTFYCSVR